MCLRSEFLQDLQFSGNEAGRPEIFFSQERRLKTRTSKWTLGPFLEVGWVRGVLQEERSLDYETCNPEGGPGVP